jgi:hypothetical protein
MVPSPGSSWPPSEDPSQASTESPVAGWLLIVVLVAALTLLVALLRYAIDLLVIVAVVWFVGWSLRAVVDRLRGDSGGPWAFGAVALSLGALALVLDAMTANPVLVPTIERHLPQAVTRALADMESHGWARRAWTPSRGSNVAPRATTAPQPASLNPDAPPPGAAQQRRAGTSGPSRTGERAKGDVGDGVHAEAAPSAQGDGPVVTFTTLETTRTTAPVGTPVQLTATVRARSGERPAGRVVFRRGTVVIGSRPVMDGRAVLNLSDLPPGTHEMTAEFIGERPFGRSHSPAIVQLTTR